mmetsp:Transcript_27429/g.69775  ORF Transcript_27429/g.69775 Transcript_27429/m.69775 type:complete len:80 (-) Transcript_27429:1775-2014(-)
MHTAATHMPVTPSAAKCTPCLPSAQAMKCTGTCLAVVHNTSSTASKQQRAAGTDVEKMSQQPPLKSHTPPNERGQIMAR